MILVAVRVILLAFTVMRDPDLLRSVRVVSLVPHSNGTAAAVVLIRIVPGVIHSPFNVFVMTVRRRIVMFFHYNVPVRHDRMLSMPVVAVEDVRQKGPTQETTNVGTEKWMGKWGNSVNRASATCDPCYRTTRVTIILPDLWLGPPRMVGTLRLTTAEMRNSVFPPFRQCT